MFLERSICLLTDKEKRKGVKEEKRKRGMSEKMQDFLQTPLLESTLLLNSTKRGVLKC